MSSTQRDQHSDIVFRGIDGSECEEFIAALEELAYAEGWTEDRRKMLFLARSRLRNGALRWFARLDSSVKNDWDLFVQALFDQYPPMTESSIDREVELATPVWSSTTFSPSFSTATLPVRSSDTAEPVDRNSRLDPSQREVDPGHDENGTLAIPTSLPYDFQRPGLHTGRLRVVSDDDATRTYLRIGPNTCNFNGPSAIWLNGSMCGEKYITRVTLDPREASIVRFIPNEEPHMIGSIKELSQNSDISYRTLGIHIPRVSDEHLQEYQPLVFSRDAVSLKDLINVSELQRSSASEIWNILKDGTLQATYADVLIDPKTGSRTISEYTMTTILVDIEGSPICFTKDYATPTALHPLSERPMVRARIVFEPLES